MFAFCQVELVNWELLTARLLKFSVFFEDPRILLHKVGPEDYASSTFLFQGFGFFDFVDGKHWLRFAFLRPLISFISLCSTRARWSCSFRYRG